MNTNVNKTGIIILVLTAFFYALGGVCVKEISWSPLSINCVRSLISLIMLFIYKRSIKLELNPTNIFGALLMATSSVFYMLANKLTTAGTTIVLEYIAPIIVLLFEVIFRNRKLIIKEFVLTFLVFIGCVLSFIDNIDVSHIMGNVLAIMSGFSYAGQLIVMGSDDSNGQDVAIIANCISFMFSLPFFIGDCGSLVFDLHNITWVLILSIFQYGLANILLSIGMKKVDKVKGSLILTLEPIINPILVVLINGEKMGPYAIIGGIIVLISVSLNTIFNDRIDKNEEINNYD